MCETINRALVMWDRERIGREASPTAVVDSQSVKTTESGGPWVYDNRRLWKDEAKLASAKTPPPS